jgi:hypothetical protein
LLNEKRPGHEPEIIMSESESAALIERLRRAKRRWKAVAISLMVMLVVATGLVGVGLVFILSHSVILWAT